jgi:uncharacterized protein YfaP (DUF2135 family)
LGAEICVQRTCIDRGNPRFTLTWTGDDDLDLALVTPLGTTVAVSNKIDLESQGEFGESGDQLGFGRHVENIYFPITGGPSGAYTYFVSSFVPNGELDTWTVSVFVDDEEVASQTGNGTSELLVFEYIGGANPSPTPIGCNFAVDECCNDSDCSGGSLCVQRTCIDDGNPRITLTWTGDDDLDLTVTPPLGETISFLNQFDEDSGGRFGEDGVQFFFGLHVENIFFPANGGPIGEYKYEVQSFNVVGGDDTWTVRVFVGGEEVSSQSGNGNSGELTYDFTMGSNLAVEDQLLADCSLSTEECCTDTDCPLEDEICVQQICIAEGNPRFTLTWTGDDNIDISIGTPLGTTVSYMYPADRDSGGVFGVTGSQFMSGPHVENVYFPMAGGGPSGTYSIEVNPFEVIGEDDIWTVQAYVGGAEIASASGTGASGVLTFEYDGRTSLPVARKGILSAP